MRALVLRNSNSALPEFPGQLAVVMQPATRIVWGKNGAWEEFVGDSGLSITFSSEAVRGNIPFGIGSFRLSAGTYLAQAEIGCGDTSHTATLLVKDGEGSLKATISGGLVMWRDADHSFTLTQETEIRLVVFGSSVSSLSFVKSFRFKR